MPVAVVAEVRMSSKVWQRCIVATFSRPPITIGTKLTTPSGPVTAGAVIGSASPVDTLRQDSACLVSRKQQ
jgi:hypothetical protein